MSTDAPGTRGGATSPPAQRLDPRRVARLLEVGRSLVSELDLDVVLERVLEVARELTGARYAALGVLDERRVELERFLTPASTPRPARSSATCPAATGSSGC